MSDLTWMRIGQVVDKEVCVEYSLPGLGFCCKRYVTEDMARLLEIAMTVGRNKMVDELNDLLRKR